MKFGLVLACLVCATSIKCILGNADFQAKLGSAKTKIDEALKKIHDRWDIEHFPNFLRSASMSHTSWEVLKVYSYLLYYCLRILIVEAIFLCFEFS